MVQQGHVRKYVLGEATSAYQRAIALNPKLVWSHNNLGDALLKSECWEEAASAYKRAIDVFPDMSLLHHNLGDALLKLERWEEADAAYQRADEINPDWSRRDLGGVLTNVERWIDSFTPAASNLDRASPRL